MFNQVFMLNHVGVGHSSGHVQSDRSLDSSGGALLGLFHASLPPISACMQSLYGANVCPLSRTSAHCTERPILVEKCIVRSASC